MIVVLVCTSWLLLTSMVIGLCASARRGDEHVRETSDAVRVDPMRLAHGSLRLEDAQPAARKCDPAQRLVGAIDTLT